jgi:site-specific DNA-methyltransferase (adenine-specific)
MLLHGDCLQLLKDIEDHSIDMILADLPYDTTACEWDYMIPFSLLWQQYKRVAKVNAPIVLTASQPFTTKLIASNIENFKHSWIWNKKATGNIFLAESQPLKIHEDICVFAYGKCNYYPIKEPRTDNKKRSKCYGNGMASTNKYVPNKNADVVYEYEDRYPTTILQFSNAVKRNLIHPTQKPVELFEYLINTYSKKNDLVLDNVIGSGTTAIAAINTGRRWIGIEKDLIMYGKAFNRIYRHLKDNKEMIEKLNYTPTVQFAEAKRRHKMLMRYKQMHEAGETIPDRVLSLLKTDRLIT